MDERKKRCTYKANLLKKYGEEQQTLQAEVDLHQRLKTIKKEHTRRKNDQTERSSKMSRENAVKLMQKYEREAKQAKEKLRKLEEKNKCSGSGKNENEEVKTEKNETKTKGVSEEELKEHIYRIVKEKSVKSLNAPFSMTDIIRQNHNLQKDNAEMKKELENLKRENSKLISDAVKYRKQSDAAMTQVGASEDQRKKLMDRLRKEKELVSLLDNFIASYDVIFLFIILEQAIIFSFHKEICGLD
ncbi:DgyrCDS5965 [Dimorphilus gyrociliatus]|uniref:DgyrCDS5965 n=1 Tax=Dimorphilus gyrociliatus TaxID=2664684 RepID=A0A7I8VLJ0_9ANNE|nr:DgyrCDS5965 [Dimorphilus gyrociliatus]